MIVGKSRWEYLLVRSIVIFYQYVGLGCVIYFFGIFALAGVPGIAHPFSIFVEVIGLIEILFYFFWYLPYHHHVQKPGIKPQLLPRSMREQLYYKCLDHVPDTEQYLRKWLRKAPMDDIRRENVKDWILWAIFNREGRPGSDNEELEDYIAAAEDKAEITVKYGVGEASPIRLDFEPVVTSHRSLLFYIVSYSTSHAHPPASARAPKLIRLLDSWMS
jgi:hypothetical protein